MKKSKKVISALIMMAVVLGGAGFGVISHAKAEPAENSDWVADFPEDTEAELEEEIEEMEETTENYAEVEDGDVFGTEEEIEETEREEPETEETQTGKAEEEQKPMVSSDGTLEPEVTVSREEKPKYKYETGYIFMGDSRIYLMNEDCSIEGTENFFAVCCPGIGYDWMIETGLPQIKNIQNRHSEIKEWVVVSALGINDMQNVNKYIASYKKLAKSVELWLVSINPTIGRTEATYNNTCINAFNKKIRRISGITYINSHDYILKKGFDTKDGLHYTEASNWDIYSYILNSLLVGRDCAPAPDTDAKELAQSLEDTLSLANY